MIHSSPKHNASVHVYVFIVLNHDKILWPALHSGGMFDLMELGVLCCHGKVVVHVYAAHNKR